jgi:hypothetical protein
MFWVAIGTGWFIVFSIIKIQEGLSGATFEKGQKCFYINRVYWRV